ncbi:MAG: hypothetical protein ACJAS1_004743 [Oleiphilaceae bacterium]|jgi:hypothetical protein
MTTKPLKVSSDMILSYRSLIGEKGWYRLHPDIQRRFTVNSAHSEVTYTGVMDVIYLSFFGKLLAQLCRIIGTPLALYSGKNIPMEVNVYHDVKLKGMTWDRFYSYPNRSMNRVKSTKCIRNNTGLIELVGFGFGMHLKVFEQNNSIVFKSTRFFWQIGSLKITIPRFLTPGTTTVKQQALDGGSFRFSLDVIHPIFKQVYYQTGVFSG